MTLQEYIEKHGYNYSTYAPRINVSPQAVRRYAQEGRIPKEKVMQAIVKDTKGKVTPNSFYE